MQNRRPISDPSPHLVLFTGHSNYVTDAAFSPDGRTLATCSYDESIILWDVRDGEIRRKLFGGGDALNSVAFSPDGRLLAAAGIDGVLLWDPNTGDLVQIIPDTCWPLAFLPDGRLLTSDCSDRPNQLAVWNLAAGREAFTLMEEETYVHSLSVSADGRTVASAQSDQIDVWNLHTQRRVQSLTAPESILDAEHVRNFDAEEVALSPDGNLVCARCLHAVRVWNVRTGEYLKTLQEAYCIAFSPDGRTLATGLSDGRIVLQDVGSWNRVRTIQQHLGSIGKLIYSPDGQLLVSAGGDHNVGIWDPKTGATAHSMRGHEHPVTSVKFSHDGESLITGCGDRTILKWNIVSGKLDTTVKIEHDRPLGTVLSSDVRLRAITDTIPSVDLAQAVHLYDAASGARLHTLSFKNKSGFPEAVAAMAFSRDGGLIALGHFGFLVTLWDTRTGTLLRKLRTSSDHVLALAFSSDGKTIATGTAYESNVELFSVKTGRKKRTLVGHTNCVDSICFSPDGRRLATGSDDGTARLWNPHTGKLLGTLLVLPGSKQQPSHEWIVYTPECYYECTSGAQRYIRWMVGSSFFAADAFAADFHRPNPLRRILRSP